MKIFQNSSSSQVLVSPRAGGTASSVLIHTQGTAKVRKSVLEFAKCV